MHKYRQTRSLNMDPDPDNFRKTKNPSFFFFNLWFKGFHCSVYRRPGRCRRHSPLRVRPPRSGLRPPGVRLRWAPRLCLQLRSGRLQRRQDQRRRGAGRLRHQRLLLRGPTRWPPADRQLPRGRRLQRLCGRRRVHRRSRLPRLRPRSLQACPCLSRLIIFILFTNLFIYLWNKKPQTIIFLTASSYPCLICISITC